ncbi:reverse transcriptase domain-containing protein [Tanacetum coccineum]
MTLRKLVYEESEEENSDSSETKDISERSFQRVLRHVLPDLNEGRACSTGKSQRSLSRSLREKDPDERRLARTPRAREYHEKAKLPRNVKVYEGSKDSEDHLGNFSDAAEQEEWLMPVWCRMFCQTLSGAARNWFDDLDPKSVDSFKELSQKFLEEFSQQKSYAKDLTEIHGIKRRMDEGL